MSKMKVIEKGPPRTNSVTEIVPLFAKEMAMVKGGDSCGRFASCAMEGKRNKCIDMYIIHCNVFFACPDRYIWPGGTNPIT